jgi:hypothetical protein
LIVEFNQNAEEKKKRKEKKMSKKRQKCKKERRKRRERRGERRRCERFRDSHISLQSLLVKKVQVRSLLVQRDSFGVNS